MLLFSGNSIIVFVLVILLLLLSVVLFLAFLRPLPYHHHILAFIFRIINLNPQVDHEEPFGPKGKTPWITLNGEDVGDSQMIIEKLAAKFGKEFDAHLSQEEKAVAHALRVMVDEYFFWYGSGLLVFALFLVFYLSVSLLAFLSNAHR